MTTIMKILMPRFLKLSQLLTLIVLIMARTGFPGASRATYADIDHTWLTIIAAGGYVIILGVMLATYLLGDAMPDKTVSS